MKRIKLWFFTSLIVLIAQGLESLGAAKKAIKPIHRLDSEWISNQINHDLKKYRSGITQTMLDEAELKMDKMATARCMVVQGIASVKCHSTHDGIQARAQWIKEILQELVKIYHLPDVDFIISLADVCTEHALAVPVFGISKNIATNQHVVLIPDPRRFALADDIIKEVTNGNKVHSWNSKIEKAFWRGSTTGGYYTCENFKTFSRTKLVFLSNNLPHHVDAKFTTLDHADGEFRKMFVNEYSHFLTTHIPISAQLKYKYLLSIDGNTWASSFYWMLFSNSLILKQNSPYTEWYYRGLKPYVHYIPIDSNFWDLGFQIDWAKKNEDDVLTIINNANSFAKKYLSREGHYYYFYKVLNEYSKLLRN